MRPWILAACLSLAAAPARAVLPDEVPELPFLSRVGPPGERIVTDLVDSGPDVPKTVDGAIDDWTGSSPLLGGAMIYSRGELVYQDHLFDAYGADDGTDAERVTITDPLAEAEPRTGRLDQGGNYIIGELGLPVVPPFTGEESYGDANGTDLVDHADLLEVRLAADADTIWLLARTTTMTAPDQTALLLLVDTAPGDVEREVPFSSGLRTRRGDVAILLSANGGRSVDLATGVETALPAGSVAVQPDGYTNAIEAALPRAGLAAASSLSLAVAAGSLGADGDLADLGVEARVANVAFRTAEPVVSWFERDQALRLFEGTIDPFFADVSLSRLESGATQTMTPGPGYHDRIFVSTERISNERGEDGVFQHYGLYVPTTHDDETTSPLHFWLHFRGGKAHTAGALIARIFKDFGEDRGTIVVSPRGRGTSSWYVSKGHQDLLEVWDDVHALFAIDPDRVYVSGHSMGGWGTYLMTVLYPDRFAAGMPVAGPPTQGLAVGCDFDFCLQAAQDDGRLADQYTLRMLPNLRHVPLAIFQGAIDELVWVSGVTRQALELQRLGYPHRYYLFPTYEHYTHPIMDEWAEGARYLHTFVRNPNPARVTYVRDMPFEIATEEVRCPECGLDFDFDHAYWMSELEPDPADGDLGVARFDGRSLAIVEPPSVTVPEAGGPTAPGQSGPFVMGGLARLEAPLGAPPAPLNGFEATLEGASNVRLDLVRMAIDPDARVEGRVTTDRSLTLRLDGGWDVAPGVTVDGAPAAAALADGVLAIPLAPGTHEIAVD